MEREADRDDVRSDSGRTESGLDALQASGDFRSSFVSPDHHESNEHIALVYETQAEQFAAVVPFVRQGLERGEKCLYVVDDNPERDLVAAMRAGGIDVDAARASGALTVLTSEAYVANGSLTPDDQLAALADAIETATEEYPAVRVVVEMTCFLDDDLTYGDLVAYEERYNRISEDVDALALCQYSRDRFPAEVVRDTIRAHPHLIVDGTLGHNIHYVPPEVYFGPERADHEVERMVATTTELAEAETGLKRQNDRLEEFASIVSHDLRNPLQVAAGHLELAREDPEGEHLDAVEEAHERMDSLIEDLLAFARTDVRVRDVEPVSLAAVTADCWTNVPTAGATHVTETDGVIRADPARLRQLLENLLRNAVEHGSTSSRPPADDDAERDGSVTVTVGDLDGETGFYLEDDGRGIPENERERVFDSGYSSVAGGTGFGLSIVRGIADAHGWSVRVTEGEDGGARFEIRGVDVA